MSEELQQKHAIEEFKKQVLAIYAETGLPIEEIMQGLMDALESAVERRSDEETEHTP